MKSYIPAGTGHHDDMIERHGYCQFSLGMSRERPRDLPSSRAGLAAFSPG
jgi:hypothetical protein